MFTHARHLQVYKLRAHRGEPARMWARFCNSDHLPGAPTSPDARTLFVLSTICNAFAQLSSPSACKEPLRTQPITHQPRLAAAQQNMNWNYFRGRSKIVMPGATVLMKIPFHSVPLEYTYLTRSDHRPRPLFPHKRHLQA